MDPLLALKSLFTDSLREDAGAVYDEMRTPSFLRLRADTSAGAQIHPLLATRIGRMEEHRATMKGLAGSLLEGDPPIENADQAVAFAATLRRALESCLRVLECSDSKEVKAKVAETAKAMGMSINTMATILHGRRHPLAEPVAEQGQKALDISSDVDVIAAELKTAYEQTIITNTRMGERRDQVAPSVPVSPPR
jgi:hypothetical protein